MGTKLIFNSNECDIYKVVSCGRVEYRIYHNENKFIMNSLEEVKDYIIKNNL